MKMYDVIPFSEYVNSRQEAMDARVKMLRRYGGPMDKLDSLVLVDIPRCVMWANVSKNLVPSLHQPGS